MSDIPFQRLRIPVDLRSRCHQGASASDRLSLAKGLEEVPGDVQLSLCYILANDDSRAVREAAIRTLKAMPSDDVVEAIGNSTHSKVLELLASVRPDDQDIGTRISTLLNANDRTILLIAQNAGPDLCERLTSHRERLLMTPKVYTVLYANPNCEDQHLQKAASFMRMHGMLPEVPEERPTGTLDLDGLLGSAPDEEMDLEAEIDAALMGRPSPVLQARTEHAMQMFDLSKLKDDDDLLGTFNFDFKDEISDFGWDLTEDRDAVTEDEKISLEKKLSQMTVGHKIKLAYLGNKEVRGILIRDRNKMVASAVIRSGRCTDGEVASWAGNRNLADDVLREIAMNPEWTRKYPVKVALVNNPKTPVSVAIAFVSQLQKRDLQELSRNHNVSSVVNQLAKRAFKQKYKR